METSGGFLGRVAERVVAWIALAGLLAAAIGIWRLGPETRGAILDGLWRFALWVATCAALPWLGRFVIHGVVGAGSNLAPAALLVGLLAADVLAGALLLTAWPGAAVAWILALACLALAAVYNYLVTAYLAEMHG